ncbi:D-threo-aldose 1-dehydrogenase [Meinhardsimonia xiamenensis]|jgi:D-threo-aldose 1-dehydrogenase|uniref:D-threo-aldose 1-dehydrogenase n=1 Tax=Meinhardsimonia xiamenensis TaxID=990712 RepID=A0A1G8YB29_9RHOB|nr:aldo/keto reductase [Meinhardsimonia xiamenensis]PRX37232.1 D-threo-aldose 1-dehydrogenase [Meinhardsimonia xiamenensis]SDJ99896.1 D-threo-aldose 1-dehydrogenase [Meinhardsimonia xiamenensis]
MAIATRHWDRRRDGGLSFTELGMGTAPLGNLYRAVSDAEAEAVLERAWAAGVRYYDTAPLYGFGLAETRLNRFLRGKPRDEYVLSTKVGRLLRACPPDARDGVGKWFDVPSRQEVYDYTYDGVMRSLEASLERLGLDRVDILFAHDLDVFNHGTREALEGRLTEFMAGGYRALVHLREQGVIRAFGAGVNEWQPCQWLAERGDFDLFLLAGRYTLLEQEALESFLPLCESRGIGIVIGGPYNSGILATGPVEGAHYNYDLAPPEILERVRRIEAVCARHGVRLVDAAFRFPLMHPAVVSVIPGGQGMPEMESNLAALEARIPPALWADLKAEGLMRPDAPTDAPTA